MPSSVGKFWFKLKLTAVIFILIYQNFFYPKIYQFPNDALEHHYIHLYTSIYTLFIYMYVYNRTQYNCQKAHRLQIFASTTFDSHAPTTSAIHRTTRASLPALPPHRHLRQFESRTIIRSLKRVNICSRLTAFAAFFLIYSALRAGTTPRAPSTYTQMYVSSSSNQFVLIFVQLWMRTADDAFPFSKMISGREVQEGCKCVCVCGCV